MMNGQGPLLDDQNADLVRTRVVEVVPSAPQAEEAQDPKVTVMIGAVKVAAHAMMHAEVVVLSDHQVEEVQDPRGRMAIAMIAAVKAVLNGHVVHPDQEDLATMSAVMHRAAHALPVRRSHGRHKAVMSASSKRATL